MSQLNSLLIAKNSSPTFCRGITRAKKGQGNWHYAGPNVARHDLEVCPTPGQDADYNNDVRKLRPQVGGRKNHQRQKGDNQHHSNKPHHDIIEPAPVILALEDIDQYFPSAPNRGSSRVAESSACKLTVSPALFLEMLSSQNLQLLFSGYSYLSYIMHIDLIGKGS